MKKTVDSLKRDGRKLKRHVMTTSTHDISLTFLCGISKKAEQMAAVDEAKGILGNSNGDLFRIADSLSALRQEYRHLGCVGYCLDKKCNGKTGEKHD